MVRGSVRFGDHFSILIKKVVSFRNWGGCGSIFGVFDGWTVNPFTPAQWSQGRPQVCCPTEDFRLRSQRRLKFVSPEGTFASRKEVANCGPKGGERNVFGCERRLIDEIKRGLEKGGRRSG